MIPAGVIKKIEGICASFLWKEGLQSAKGAKVSWFSLSFPKAEGGLGLRNLKCWNKSCFLQNFWNLFSQSGSLWIAWIKEYYIKGRDIWQLPISAHSSWTWKKMLKLRSVVASMVIRQNDTVQWLFRGQKYSSLEVWNHVREKRGKVV